MTASNESIRHIFLHGHGDRSGACALERAQYATDTSYMGFEDPRSAAVGPVGMERKVQKCGRPLCKAYVKINIATDTFELDGECKMADLCAKEVHDGETPETRERELVKIATSEILSFCCPRVACEYNYGFTIDGNAGEARVCMRAAEVQEPQQ